MEILICDTQSNQQGATINDSVCNWQVALSVDQKSDYTQVACQNPGLSHIHMTYQTWYQTDMMEMWLFWPLWDLGEGGGGGAIIDQAFRSS